MEFIVYFERFFISKIKIRINIKENFKSNINIKIKIKSIFKSKINIKISHQILWKSVRVVPHKLHQNTRAASCQFPSPSGPHFLKGAENNSTKPLLCRLDILGLIKCYKCYTNVDIYPQLYSEIYFQGQDFLLARWIFSKQLINDVRLSADVHKQF